jgi:hypothetical protein
MVNYLLVFKKGLIIHEKKRRKNKYPILYVDDFGLWRGSWGLSRLTEKHSTAKQGAHTKLNDNCFSFFLSKSSLQKNKTKNSMTGIRCYEEMVFFPSGKYRRNQSAGENKEKKTFK